MKKIYLIMLMLSIAGYAAQAQSWFPIGATWHYDIPAYMGTLGGGGAIKIEVIKDTAIGNTTCKILSHLSYSSPTDSFWEKNIYAYEKNDSVYFLRNDTFRLTYDLSRPMTDSITMRLYYDSVNNLNSNCLATDTTLRFHIDSSGVINQNGQTLRYYFAYQAANPEIIEKIGSTEFIYPFYNCILDYALPQLTCYSDSVLGLYQVDSTMPCLSFLTAIQNVSNRSSISIYPNPSSDQLFIKTENIQPVSISVYDVDGRMIFTQPFNPEININHLSSGAYFMEVNSKEGVVRKRFVKM